MPRRTGLNVYSHQRLGSPSGVTWVLCGVMLVLRPGNKTKIKDFGVENEAKIIKTG